MEQPSDNLYVTNLPTGFTEQTVTQLFSVYGVVTSCKVLLSSIPGSKTAALVRFASIEEAASILQTLNGSAPAGLQEPLQIKFAIQKDKGKGKDKTTSFGGWNASPTTDRSSPWSWGQGGGEGEWSIGGKGTWNGGWKGGGEAEWSTGGKGGWKGGGEGEWSTGGKGPFQAAWNAGWTGDCSGGKKGEWKGGYKVSSWTPPAPPPPAKIGTVKAEEKTVTNGLDSDTLVELVYQSGSLPGGQKYSLPESTLYIAGLPADTTETHLYKMFSPYGAVHSCSTKNGGTPGNYYCVGFINYLHPVSAESAITAYHGMVLPDGSTLKVSLKKQSKPIGDG